MTADWQRLPDAARVLAVALRAAHTDLAGVFQSLDAQHILAEHWQTIAPKICLNADSNEVWRHFRDLQTNRIVVAELFGVRPRVWLPSIPMNIKTK